MSFSVGIDLGTTNTVVSTARKGITGNIEVSTEHITQLAENGEDIENSVLLPSVLYVYDGDHYVGNYAKGMRTQTKNRVISNSKNFIGKRDYKWNIDKSEYSPEIVASYFLSAARNYLIEQYDHLDSLENTVITVPASFDMDQRNATRNAAKLAGFNGEIILISEPTASILDFINEQSKLDDSSKFLDFNDFKNVLVFDLGGGTCDVAILKIKIQNQDIYVEEVSVSPHTLVGGTNFDAYAVEGVIKDYSKEHNIDLNKDIDKESLRELKSYLLNNLEKVKMRFSSQYFVKKQNKNLTDDITEKISFDLMKRDVINGKPFKFNLTMKRYNEYIKALITEDKSKENIINPINEALSSSNICKENIDYVFCVGGMTKYPAVWQCVSEYLGKEPYKFSDAMESVSRGAAIYNHFNIINIQRDESIDDTNSNEVNINIIPTLPQTVFLNVKNKFPEPLIKAKTKAGEAVIYEDLIKVNSEIGVVLELYTGRSIFDPEMKKLNNIKIDFPYGVKVGTSISLKLEYQSRGVLSFEAWIKDNPDIKVNLTLEGAELSNEEIKDIQETHSIENVKGVV